MVLASVGTDERGYPSEYVRQGEASQRPRKPSISPIIGLGSYYSIIGCTPDVQLGRPTSTGSENIRVSVGSNIKSEASKYPGRYP
eukprot:scaffold657512_cov108-Prasinocladus_malaysianus.AAC.1